MLRVLIVRLTQAVVVLIGITAVCFLILHLTADPAALMLPESAGPDQYAAIRHQLGLDQPLLVQFLDYMGRALRLDFGLSYQQNRPAMEVVLNRLPATIELATTAFLIALLVALPVGIISATHRNTVADFGAMSTALIGQSMPNFWLGLLLILLFSVNLGILPAAGRLSFGLSDTAHTDFYLFEGLLTLNLPLLADAARHILLPAITAGLYSSAKLTRLVRSSMLDTLSEDYIRTARAKGQSEFIVVNVHALKNASIPLLTLGGLELGLLLGGTVVTETVFAWPGVGLLSIQALNNHDFPVIQATVFLLALIFVVVNFSVDLLYAWLDPRIRHAG
jgi:ABC-type dipeptide/oligopeptide/nickel transport system permease component